MDIKNSKNQDGEAALKRAVRDSTRILILRIMLELVLDIFNIYVI